MSGKDKGKNKGNGDETAGGMGKDVPDESKGRGKSEMAGGKVVWSKK